MITLKMREHTEWRLTAIVEPKDACGDCPHGGAHMRVEVGLDVGRLAHHLNHLNHSFGN